MSAAVHVVLLLVLPLVLVSRATPGLDEAPRPAAIVLARPGATTEVEYFSEQDARSEVNSREDVSPSHEAAALPAAAAASALAPAGPRLPEMGELLAGVDGALLDGPQLTVSGRARVPSGLDPGDILAAEAVRRAASAARGPQAELRLFGGASSQGRSFVFLIDRSKSMGEQGLGALRAAEAELARAVDGLQPVHRFQVVAYHHQSVFLQRRRELLPATDLNKQAIPGYLSGLAAFGSTEHQRALITALALEPDVIYLLTDGGDPVLSAGDIANLARDLRGRTTVHCIHFGRGPLQAEDNFLRRLATSTGGGYGYVDLAAVD